jgi:phosphoglycolate phosphatase
MKEEMKRHYAAHLHETTTAYPGVEALLEALHDLEIPLAVLSNKPHAWTVELVEKLFDANLFRAVLGHREGFPRKPDPAGAREILNRFSLKAEAVLYVGDSEIDIRTGKAAGTRTVGVTWGFRDRGQLAAEGPDELIDHPREVLRLIQGKE